MTSRQPQSTENDERDDDDDPSSEEGVDQDTAVASSVHGAYGGTENDTESTVMKSVRDDQGNGNGRDMRYSHNEFGSRIGARPNYCCPCGTPSIGDTGQDISLTRFRNRDQYDIPTAPPQMNQLGSGEWSPLSSQEGSRTPVRGNSATESTSALSGRGSNACLENSATESSSYKPRQAQLAMNIPPSMHQSLLFSGSMSGRGMAEQQLSFRTLSTRNQSLLPVGQNFSGCLEPTSHLNQPHDSERSQYNAVYAHPVSQQPHSDLGHPAASGGTSTAIAIPPKLMNERYRSIEDNEQNFSVSSASRILPMTAQLVPQQQPQLHQQQRQQLRHQTINVDHISPGTSYASPNVAAPSPSPQNSIVNSRTFINENIKVIKLPRSIVQQVVGIRLEIDGISGTWKDLVEMYGWDYDRTHIFEHHRHQNGIFCALLHEPEFQGYTLGQLKQDLYHLPRRDILDELDRRIDEHNSNVPARRNMAF